MKLKNILSVFALMLASYANIQAQQTKVIAHRGFWKTSGSAQNSITALVKVRLNNGEQLPTLEQYLSRGQQLTTRLILELKPHRTPEQETKAIEGIVRMIKDFNLENRVEYISFSKHATKEFIRLAPKGTPVYYLSGDATPQELKSWGCAGPDYHFSVFQKNPEWIEQCHKLGMKVNAWTVNDAKNMQWLIEHKVDFITTNEPILLQQELKM